MGSRVLAIALVLAACGDDAARRRSPGRRHHRRRSHADGVPHPAANLTRRTSSRSSCSARARSTSAGRFRSSVPRSTTTRASAVTAAYGRGTVADRPMASSTSAARSREALVRVSLARGHAAMFPAVACRCPATALQLQDHATVGARRGRASTLTWIEHVEIAYGDGTTVIAARAAPRHSRRRRQSDCRSTCATSFRTAPQVIGLGLLEAVPEPLSWRGRSGRR